MSVEGNVAVFSAAGHNEGFPDDGCSPFCAPAYPAVSCRPGGVLFFFPLALGWVNGSDDYKEVSYVSD